MRVEYFEYQTPAAGVSPRMLKFSMPDAVQRALLSGDLFDDMVAVGFHNVAGAKVVETFLNNEQPHRWVRTHRLEVDQSEIEDFTHFAIALDGLTRGGVDVDGFPLQGDVHFEALPPACTVANCYSGSTNIGPFAITNRAVKKLGPAGLRRIVNVWKANLVAMAPEVHAVLLSEQVSGITFLPATATNNSGRSAVPAYVGQLDFASRSLASTVVLGEQICTQHRYVSTAWFGGGRIGREALHDVDVQLVDRVWCEDDRHMYHLRMGSIVVTRKVLQLILRSRIKGPSRVTTHLREIFLPILFC